MREANFRDKYIQINIISKFLLDNFFLSVRRLTLHLNIKGLLEIGCGEGFSTVYLRNFFPSIRFEASDVDCGLVHIAKARNSESEIIFKEESVYSLQRSNNAFDLVCALEVLEHLDVPRQALIEIHRVTNKYAVISVPWEPWWRAANMLRGKYLADFGNTPGHINHWSRKAFCKEIEPYFILLNSSISFPWMIFLLEKRNK